MAVQTEELRFSTRGDSDVVDITGNVQRMVEETGTTPGQTLAFVRGSTAAISTMEFEPVGYATCARCWSG